MEPSRRDPIGIAAVLGLGVAFLNVCRDTSSINAIYLNGESPEQYRPAAGLSKGEVTEMPTDNRFMTAGLILGVLGMGIGVGLVIASFMVGPGTATGSSLSSSGTITIIAFVVLTVVLSAASRRQRQIGGQS